MSALLAGALISGGLALGKSILGGIQASRGAKEQKRLLANRPKYSIPEAYQKALGIAQQMAAGEMPGQQRYEQLIGESTARTMTNAERGSISSSAYQSSVESAQDKELQALQNLALMGVEYKTKAMQNLQQAQNTMGGLQDTQWEMNQLRPWEQSMNMAQENRQSGWQNLYGGLSDLSGSVMNLVGTKYMAQAMAGIQNSGVGNMASNPNQQFSKPLGNLAKPLTSLIPNALLNPSQTPYEARWENLNKQGYTNG